MKNKGFTLIELLAVIVILAIIALIATPIVLNIINDTRESSNQRSMELYARAVQNAVAHYMMLNPNDTDVTFDDIEKYISYDGAKVECKNPTIKDDGSIVLDDCTVNGEVGYSYGVSESAICTSTTETIPGEYTTSPSTLAEVVTCGSEQFYVMENDGSTITMLAKYNLSTTVSPYLQSETNAGTIGWGYETSDEVSNWPKANEYIYDTMDNPIKPIVNTYKDYLKNTVGVNVLSAGLMSSTQAQNIGLYFSSGSGSSCSEDKGWACSTHYWLGYVDQACDDYWCAVANSDYVLGSGFVGGIAGIRPVVTISASEVG